MICARPDICFVVGRLSQHMENPTQSLWTAVKHVFRQIAGTASAGIVYSGAKQTLGSLVGYSDSNWAGCRIDSKGTTGYVFWLAGGAVSWKSKKQSVITTSTGEAEYLALGSAVQECLWTGRLFSFATGDSTFRVAVKVDNHGSIKMAKNNASGNPTKHIDMKYHLVRDLYSQTKSEVEYCPSTDMLADVLTKPLGRTLLVEFYTSLGLHQ